ncbi:MAG: hypothetical protein ACRD3E_00605 [Terriglobales bacterium]
MILVWLFASLASVSAAQSITVSLSGGSVRWDNTFGNSLVPGRTSNPGSATVTVTTSWSGLKNSDTVTVYAYFNNATAALAHTSANCTTGCPDIPASAVEIKVDAGAFTPVNGTGAFGGVGASLVLLSVPIHGANHSGSSANLLSFNINLSSLPQLPADTYNGTLNIQAQSTP